MLQNIIDDLKNQGIEPDLAQSNLLSELINTTPRNKSLINRIKKKKSQIRSFYVWGDVGRGKTLILKSFIKNLNLRIFDFHYIDFMNTIHNQLSEFSGIKNPLDSIAKSFSKKCDILFIDEFQVEDIADAMIIGNLLNQLIEKNIFIYLTSNAHPGDLYQDGLQREKFQDSMKLFQKFAKIYKLDAKKDYRTRNIIDFSKDIKDKIYSDKDIANLVEINFQNINFKNKTFQVNDRVFSCKAESNNFLWLSFSEFFSEPNGNKDFIKISKKIDWIFISDFKYCDDDSADIIRRFISFIDICYRDKTKIKFFFNHVDENIYTGKKLKILWDRCHSRLIEMQTKEYLI